MIRIVAIVASLAGRRAVRRRPQLPTIRHAFEAVFAAVFDREPRPCDEVAHSAAHKCVATIGVRRDSRGDVHAETREVVNYIRAMGYGLERLKELPLSLRLIQFLLGNKQA